MLDRSDIRVFRSFSNGAFEGVQKLPKYAEPVWDMQTSNAENTVVKFCMNAECGYGTGCFRIKKGQTHRSSRI